MLFEQNARGSTFGFGVVFSDRAMDFLRADDAKTADAITSRMESWSNMTIVHRGERMTIDGVGFSAIGRLDLLTLFQNAAEAAGVRLNFRTAVEAMEELEAFGLIVAADGINSLARRTHEAAFQTSITQLDEKFAWFGTTKPFETLTQTFIETEHGAFQRTSLPLSAKQIRSKGHEHLHRRMRCRRLAARRARHDGRRGFAALLPKPFRRDARRTSADRQQVALGAASPGSGARTGRIAISC